MAHTYDTKNRTEKDDSNPVLVSITPTSGATLLVLGLVMKYDVDRTGGAPTFDGVALTQAGSTQKSTTEATAELWYLISPSIGTYNVSVPNTGAEEINAVASVFKAGAGLVSAFDVVTGGNGESADPSFNITPTVDGAVIVDVMGTGKDTVPYGNTQTILYSTDNGSYSDNHQYALQATAGQITFGWSVAYDDWAMVVAAFKTVSDGPPAEAIMNQFQGPNIGADLFNGALL